MKSFAYATLLSLPALLGFVQQAKGDFHIFQGQQSGGGQGTGACPSNYYNCDCFAVGHRRAEVETHGTGTIDGLTFFQMKPSLCGMGTMNFYQQDDGSWQFYIDGGDGTVQGTCYGNNAETTCTSEADNLIVTDKLVCYSYICGE
jgi:hypothetical protein